MLLFKMHETCMKPIEASFLLSPQLNKLRSTFYTDFEKLKLTTTQWRPHLACSLSSASCPSASSWTESSPPSPQTTPEPSWTPSSSPGGEVHPSASGGSLTSLELVNLFQKDPESKRPWSPLQPREGTEDWAVDWVGREHQNNSNYFLPWKKSVPTGCYNCCLCYIVDVIPFQKIAARFFMFFKINQKNE